MQEIKKGDGMPAGEWRAFYYKYPIMLLRMDGAFCVTVDGQATEGQAGDFLATDGHGEYWIIRASDVRKNYQEMGNGLH